MAYNPPANPYTADWYRQKISSEYQFSTNYLAWFAANIQLFQDIIACVTGFSADLDLSQAIGAQLDLLGVILGQSRTVSFQPSNSVSPVLDDTTYRLLLQATVYRNHWNGKLSSLRTIWNLLFPSGVLLFTDNQNMTVNFYIAAAFTSIIQDLISHDLIIPRPQGVLYIYSFATLPLLGYDESTPYIAGWATLVLQTTGDTNSTTSITVTSAAGILDGQTVYGPGIPAGTTVTNVSGLTITLSASATATASGVPIGFYTTDLSGHYA